MGKHTDALGILDKFKAPWESETGTDAELNPAKLKTYLYNLTLDKAKAQDARDEAAEKVTAVEQELVAAKADVAKGDSTGKIAELEKKLTDAQTGAKATTERVTRLEVALEKGLTEKQASRLVGSTKDELAADADEFLVELGRTATPNEEDKDDKDDDGNVVRQSPRILTNPADPKGGPQAEVDYEKAADQIFATRRF